MATVYVHAGLPKTGTTALQRFLWENGGTLKKHGVVYPHMKYSYKGVNFHRNGHFLLAPFVDEQGKEHHDRPCAEFGDALDELKRLGETYDRIILSDEIIWRTRWKWENYWQRVRQEMNSRGLELKVIVYLRRQDLWTEGFWAQRVKDGSPKSFSEFLELFLKNTCYVDYYDYMNHLVPVIGRENLIIRIYEKGQYRGAEGNLHSDFLDIFGLSLSDGFVIGKEIQNTRLDGAYLEMRRMLNAIPISENSRTVFQEGLKKAQMDAATERYAYFSPEERRAFMKRFEADNEKLAREYLGRADGVLFREEAEDLPQMNISERELLEAVIGTCARVTDELVQDRNRLRTELCELREDVLWYRVKRKANHLFGKKNGK